MRRPPSAYNQRFDTVLFDLDGTLLDTAAGITASLQFALETHLGMAPDKPTLLDGIGTPLRPQLKYHAEKQLGETVLPSLIESMAATFIEHNDLSHDESVKAFPGAKETLKILSKGAVNVGLVTSKPHEMAVRGLALTDLLDFFQLILGADDVRFHKPHPEPVCRALKMLGASPARTLFVGDSPWDLWAGRGMGVATGAALWGPFDKSRLHEARPSYILENLGEIPALCDLVENV